LWTGHIRQEDDSSSIIIISSSSSGSSVEPAVVSEEHDISFSSPPGAATIEAKIKGQSTRLIQNAKKKKQTKKPTKTENQSVLRQPPVAFVFIPQ